MARPDAGFWVFSRKGGERSLAKKKERSGIPSARKREKKEGGEEERREKRRGRDQKRKRTPSPHRPRAVFPGGERGAESSILLLQGEERIRTYSDFGKRRGEREEKILYFSLYSIAELRDRRKR